ncbi:HAMP domain-containing histidine kinase [Paracoccus sp. TK19116]|uniref:histidine kinase n=1 Tax=Paracoccus albicereus TaxID=2922394 RepID=A0ABT1MTH5_9RHOB|nr:HAMP domain-containing sensor histidine kinase [Paracoccus albicereus]MCQ0971439.1 HAMP domain-containing histidine kinase [Paracoccus albicereus]
MNRRSLRLRLGLIGGFAVLGTLVLSLLGLALLFDRHIERVAVADLKSRSYSVMAMIELSEAQTPVFRREPVDPRYEQPFSGHYWQLELGSEIRRSRSLWDVTLPRVGPALSSGSERVLDLTGPRGAALLAYETWVTIGEGDKATEARVVLASDRAGLLSAREGFIRDLLPYSFGLGAMLLVAFWSQVTVGIRPLTAVSERVSALRAGQVARMGGELPAEVMPLATEIDTLLTDRDQELMRARNRAADMAHGLKTPLQALMGDAEQLRHQGQEQLADSIERIAGSMQGLVDRELRRARIRSDRSVSRADLARVIDGVVKVLRRTPSGSALLWEVDVPPGLAVSVDAEDLAEAIGAVAENAARHARTQVAISAVTDEGRARITLADDGLGVPAEALEKLMARGFRLDERSNGQGFGLAIVAEIVTAAGGTMALDNGFPGLTVTLCLPLAIDVSGRSR